MKTITLFLLAIFIIPSMLIAQSNNGNVTIQIMGTHSSVFQQIKQKDSTFYFNVLKGKEKKLSIKPVPITWKFNTKSDVQHKGELIIFNSGIIQQTKMNISLKEFRRVISDVDTFPDIHIFKEYKNWLIIRNNDYAIQLDNPDELIFSYENKKKVENIQVEIADANLELTTLRSENNNLDNKLKNRDSKIADIKQENSQLKERNQEYLKEIDLLKTERDSLKTRFDSLKRVTKSYFNKIEKYKQVSKIFWDIEQKNKTEKIKDILKGSHLSQSKQTNLYLPNAISIEFVLVKKDTFKMGLTKQEVNEIIRLSRNPIYEIEEVESDKRTRVLGNFFIGRFEITEQEFYSIMSENKKTMSNNKKPMTNLTLEEIRSFCGKLNELYPELEIGLPKETEWEYAARGRKLLRYSWGNNFNKNKANVESEELLTIDKIVNQQSWCGAIGMIGNAAEICEVDRTSYLKKAEASIEAVARGGSFRADQYNCRTTSRHLLYNTQRNEIGFRIVIREKK